MTRCWGPAETHAFVAGGPDHGRRPHWSPVSSCPARARGWGVLSTLVPDPPARVPPAATRTVTGHTVRPTPTGSSVSCGCEPPPPLGRPSRTPHLVQLVAHEVGRHVRRQDILQEEAVHALHGLELLALFPELLLPQAVQAAVVVDLRAAARRAPVSAVRAGSRASLWAVPQGGGSPGPPPVPPQQGGAVELSRARDAAGAPWAHLSGEHDEGGVEENQVEADRGLQIPAHTGRGAAGWEGEGGVGPRPHAQGAGGVHPGESQRRALSARGADGKQDTRELRAEKRVGVGGWGGSPR